MLSFLTIMKNFTAAIINVYKLMSISCNESITIKIT